MRNLARKLGVRGAAMLLCAYIWLWLGLGNFRDVQSPRPGVIYLMVPPDIRAGVWFVAATAAALTAWSRRASYIGLVLLAVPPIAVVGSYGYAWVLALTPGGAPGYPDAYFNAAIYGALPALVAVTAAIPSPPAVLIRVDT